MNKVFIHATNIHQGGGRSLLCALLMQLDSQHDFILSLDSRMPLPEGLPKNISIRRVAPSVIDRLKAEIWLVMSVKPKDTVFCFGNLPPLFRLCAMTSVFVQNRYLVEDVSLKGFPLKIRIRLFIERWWIRSRRANVDKYIVQTPTMKRLLEVNFEPKVSIQILPFIDEPHGYMREFPEFSGGVTSEFDFVYVGSGEPHKNHRRLIEAWCLLAQQGLYPSLCLTLDKGRFSELCSLVNEMRQRCAVNIVNLGLLSHPDVLALYRKSAAAIYPSQFESFGLPLIEARQAGLPVLASELDYVRDAIDPEQVFDPNSSTSIARAVRRFLRVSEPPLPLLDGVQFLASILNKNL